jgi:TonB-dependent SusC/RagA subfamily outer membrane receptor
MKKSFIYQRLLFQIVKISLLQLSLIIVFTNITMAIPAKGQEMLDSKVSLTLNNVSLEKALSELEKTALIKFSYNSRALKINRIVSVYANNEALSNVLNKLLKPLSIKYVQVSNRIVLRKDDEQNDGFSEEAEQTTKIDKIASADITIKGTVTDENGEKLPGVSITVKGTTRGITTNTNGEYAITVTDDKTVLVFSYVGFEPQEIIVGNRTNLNIALKTDNKALNEVVVVGYGTQKRADLTGAVASVTGASIQNLPVSSVSEALQGRMPGVEVIKSSAAPGSAASIIIRGVSSLQNKAPLYIVDGIRQSGDNFNVQDIESVDVLKDASAASIYGAAAAGGVIIITTKRGAQRNPPGKLQCPLRGQPAKTIPTAQPRRVCTTQTNSRSDIFTGDESNKPTQYQLDGCTLSQW